MPIEPVLASDPSAERIGLADAFGLRPARKRLAETVLALTGDGTVPRSKWGLSSLRIFKPSISFPAWLGRRRSDRLIPILNLYNRTQTPIEDGWSVRVTQVRDFRGGRLTYDSHNGTDFVVPVGTRVAAAAGGVVIRVSNEFHRGGLKVFVDHGQGVVTSYNHLAVALVKVGDRVDRGQVIARSGASGLDNVVAFPWTAPHVHFNVFLDGVHVDPYAAPGSGETSLWIGGTPVPATGGSSDRYVVAAYDEQHLAAIVDGCKSAELQRTLKAMTDVRELGAELLFQTTYFPTRFDVRLPIYRERHPRREILALPFLGEDFAGVWFPD